MTVQADWLVLTAMLRQPLPRNLESIMVMTMILLVENSLPDFENELFMKILISRLLTSSLALNFLPLRTGIK